MFAGGAKKEQFYASIVIEWPHEYLRFMICTNRKKALIDLPPTCASIQGHLLQAYYFTSSSLKTLDTEHSQKLCDSLKLSKFSIFYEK